MSQEKEIVNLMTSEYSWEQIIYKIVAWEGLDPWDLLRDTAGELDRLVKEIIDRVSTDGGHILNTGGQTAVETPVVNVETVIQAARAYWG